MLKIFESCKKGFTLLELLVVVLIIGILASIALPQYKKAILKSKLVTIKNMTHAIYQAEQRYYLLHNSYTRNWNNLDIDRGGADCVISVIQSYIYCNLRDKQGNPILQYLIMTSPKYDGKIRCDAFPADPNSLTNKICQEETNRSTPNAGCPNQKYCSYIK